MLEVARRLIDPARHTLDELLEYESFLPTIQDMAKGYNGDLFHSAWTDCLWVAIKLPKSRWMAEMVNDGYLKRMVSEILMYFSRIAEKTHMLPMLEDIVFRCRPQEFTVDDIPKCVCRLPGKHVSESIRCHAGGWIGFA